jgi:membrane-associated phospholipid phosphatase
MRLIPISGSTRRLVLATALCAVHLAAPATLGAQQQPSPDVTQQGRPVSVDSGGVGTLRSRPPLFTRRDLVITAALATTAAALIPADDRIAREFQRPGPQSSALLRETAEGVEMIGSPGALVFGGSLYVAGLVIRRRGVADFGWHTLEALAISAQVTDVLKGTFGRSRPYAAAGDARDFDLGAGFGSDTRRSLPSGHTSAAFTLASVVSAESAHRWPRAHRLIAPLAYAAATGVGLSRMYQDKHWASDVALGAAIGTLTGRMVVRHAHGRPSNIVDRVALWAAGGR